MNEIDLIRRQLATECQHFAEVASDCAANVGSHPDFNRACAQYLAFAVTRMEGHAKPGPLQALLTAARAAPDSSPAWKSFFAAFNEQLQKRIKDLDALAARNPLVTEWRSASGIDADSIVTERTLYNSMKATMPAKGR